MKGLLKRLGCAGSATLLFFAASASSAQHVTAAATGAAAAPAAPAVNGADALFARWDTNHDRLLSPVEFRAGWDALQKAAVLQRLHAQFVSLDVDKNGCLNAAEYAHMALVERAGKAAPPMSAFDTQRNQCLDFKEYVVVVDTLLSRDKK